MMEVQNRLRVILAMIPMTQKELRDELEKLGHPISAAALSQIVSNKTRPELATALLITRALHSKWPGTLTVNDIWYLSKA